MKLYEGKIEIRFLIFFFVVVIASFWPLFTQEKVNWEYMLFSSNTLLNIHSFPHLDLGAAQCDCSFLLFAAQQLNWSHSVTL